MKKTNIFGLVLILSTLLIGCAQSSPDDDIPEVYTITAAETTNGTISLSKTTAAAGETITVTATPASGYSLASISAGENITLTGDGNAKTFTMPASNVTVTATFTQTNYSITAAETTNGTISLSKTTAAAGETVTVTATPASGYNVFDIKVGDNHLVISANNTTEFTMPSSNVNVSVTFISNVTPIQLYKGTTRLENNLNCNTFTLGNSDYGLLPNIGEGITYSKLRVFVSDNNIIGLGNIRYKPIDFDWESSVLRIYLQVSDN